MKNKIIKRTVIAVSSVVLACGAILGALELGICCADREMQWRPDYAKVDLTEVLEKETLTDEDYELIFAQTGLARAGVDGMRRNKSRIRRIQDAYFAENKITCSAFAPFSRTETMQFGTITASLQDGDIIVTPSTHISAWRMGHSALVTDASRSEIMESLGPGKDSQLSALNTMTNCAAFVILRPKLDQEIRSRVAEYAVESLLGVPYDATVGVLSPKYREEGLTRTQCAHLVWYAYKHFGVDIDSNGGAVVAPRDFLYSEFVEVVQIYGVDPQTLWL